MSSVVSHLDERGEFTNYDCNQSARIEWTAVLVESINGVI